MRMLALLGAAAVLIGGTGAVGAPEQRAQIAVSTADARILLIDASGKRIATLTRPKRPTVADWAPAWSPDGSRVAFVRTTDGRRSFHIYVMRANGTAVRRVTTGRFDESPAWSPDGRWIAYASAEGLRLVRPDGSGRRLVPGTGEIRPGCSTPLAADPTWAPASRLGFSFHPETPMDWPASCKSRSSRCGWVLTARLDGRVRRPVVHGRDAHWSPDARRVVYTPPNGGVATAAASGHGSRFLSRGYLANWSPDGRQIVFARMGEGSRGDTIWVMNANGSNRHRIFRGATMPAWRPR